MPSERSAPLTNRIFHAARMSIALGLTIKIVLVTRQPAYAALGFATGAVAATFVLLLTVQAASTPPPTLALVSKGINELLFPIGCSMVLLAPNTLGQRMRLAVAA